MDQLQTLGFNPVKQFYLSEVGSKLRMLAMNALAAGVADGDVRPELAKLLLQIGAWIGCDAVAVYAFGPEKSHEVLAEVGNSDCYKQLASSVAAGADEDASGIVVLPLLAGGQNLGCLAYAVAGKKSQLKQRELLDDIALCLIPFVTVHLQNKASKSAHAVLVAREAQINGLLEVSNELIQSVSPKGKLLYVNGSWLRTLGYTQSEVAELSIFDVIHPDSIAHCQVAFQEIFQGKAMLNVSIVFKDRKGEAVHVVGNAFPRIVDGKVEASKGFFRNVTEQKKVELALQHERMLVEKFLNAAPEAIAFLNSKSMVVRVNLEFTKLFGFAPEEAIGFNINDLVVPNNLRAEGGTLCQRALTAKVTEIETVRKRKDGSEMQVLLLVIPVSSDDMQISIIAIYRDISKRKQMELQLARAERMEAVGRLAGGIAHDFNNLLTVINGTVEMLIGDLPPGNALIADLEAVAHAGANAAGLTQQLLAYSRKQLIRPVPVDLNGVVECVAKMLRLVVGKCIHVEIFLSDKPTRVKADPAQLEQVIMNLGLNARDAMPAGGTLQIWTDHVQVDEPLAHKLDVVQGRYVVLRILDNGVGMDERVKVRLFEPFFSTKTASGRGSGLGLASVHAIVQQSGGSVSVASKLGSGSEFLIYLPATMESIAIIPVDDCGRDLGGGETVLVVEDDLSVRLLVERVLCASGYTVLLANGGQEAMDLLRGNANRIDLVFTDVVMPDMGGPELAQLIGTHWPKIPVLFASGFSDDEVFCRGLLDLSFQFLPKPFSAMGLRLKVRQILDRKIC